jgi:hypothetical protein
MRWSYKNVHYDYKKEGLLGGTFLDEAEIEQSMNEFGRAGWELVSLFEIQDGLMAIFKQPLDLPARQSIQPTGEVKRDEQPVPIERAPRPSRGDKPDAEDASDKEDVPIQDVPVSAPPTSRSASTKVEKKRPAIEEDTNSGVGSIRIE